MKWRRLPLLALLLLSLGGWNVHGGSSRNGGLSQGQGSFLQVGYDDAFINAFKGNQGWTTVSGALHPTPDELDANGYPLYGSDAMVNHGGVFTVFFGPSQYERPGNHIILFGGAGAVTASETGTGAGTVANVSCQYTSNGGALTAGTYTTGKCDTSACTGTCTGRWVFSVSGETINSFIEWSVGITAINSGNTIQNLAFIHANDETIFGWSMASWPGPNAVSHTLQAANSGEIFGVLYRQRIAQGGFGVWRHMGWNNTQGIQLQLNVCATWEERTPTSYFTYYGAYQSSQFYVGIPSYALNGSSNDYAIASLPAAYSWPGYTPGGAPQRNQVVVAYWDHTSTNNTITFNLADYGVQTINDPFGGTISGGSTYYFPTAGRIGALIYDPDLNSGAGGWMTYSGPSFGFNFGVTCGVPPEVDLQFNIETRTHPWFDAYTFSLVPISDYMISLATYVKTNEPPWMIARYTAGNEPFSSQAYGSNKAAIYWGGGYSYYDWYSMAASLLCQALYNVYGDKTKYECMVEPQTTGALSANAKLIESSQYVAAGPAQAGYAQDPAYKWLTAIAMNNYWQPAETGTQQEVADAYNYSNGGNQATILTNYVATALNAGPYTILQYQTFFANYATWLTTGSNPCYGNTSGCGIKNLYFYEGGYSLNFATADKTVPITGVTSNASPCVLTTASGNGVGGVTGQAWALSAIVNGGGGTWVTTPGTYSGTMSANGTSTTLTLGLDCTSLGALTSATLTYTGSKAYMNTMQQASYSIAEVGTLNLQQYNNAISAGGKWPSMSVLAGQLQNSSYEWNVWAPDIYGATSSASDPGTPQWQCIQNFNNVPGISCP